jgi:pimeloyl-ACP methyl ester carboxylesterase
MKRLVIIAYCSLSLGGITAAQTTERVDIGGNELEAVVMGVGEPVVVIEAGLGESGGNWRSVQESLSQFTTVVTYSRAGYGDSDSSPRDRTPRDMAQELRVMLDGLAVPRPIVLVGHSLGGMISRAYAAQFPNEIAGLVLVDGTHERTEQEHSVLSPTFWEDTWAGIESFFETREPVVEDEATEWWRISEAGSLPEAWPLPDVPMVVLTAMQTDDSWAGGSAEGMRIWRRLHSEYLENSTQAIHHVTGDSGHNIHVDQPELVVESIEWVVSRVR